MKYTLTVLLLITFISYNLGQNKILRRVPDEKSFRHDTERETKLSAVKTPLTHSRKADVKIGSGINGKELNQMGKESLSTADIRTGYLYQIWNDPNWEDNLKYSAVLDGSGYIVEEVWQTWNGSEWVNTDKETETHDVNGNWLEWIWYEWDGNWIEKQKQTQTYDINENWTEWILYKWNNGWADSLKLTATYDLNGNWTELLGFVSFGSGWEPDDRETQSYDLNGNWTEWLDYNLDGGNWVLADRWTQEYDANGNWTQWIDYDRSGSDCVPDNRETLEYDGNENWTDWKSYDWSGSWIEDERETQSYNGDGNWEVWTHYNWTISGWLADEKENAEYNGDKIILWTSQQWVMGAWVNSWQEDYIYDSSNNNTELIYKEWNGTDWENMERYTYTYSPVSGISVIPGRVFTYNLSENYPNPFNPSTLIQYQLPENGFVSLKIYDITGREIASLVNQDQTSGKYAVSFDAADLASGLYLYQLKVNNFTSTKKMMLLK